MTTTGTKKDLEQLVIRLERNHESVLRLRNKMNSYRYEPKDYECFIKLRNLRSNIKELIRDERLLIDQLKGEAIEFKESNALIDTILMRYKQLDADIAGYLLDAQKH